MPPVALPHASYSLRARESHAIADARVVLRRRRTEMFLGKWGKNAFYAVLSEQQQETLDRLVSRGRHRGADLKHN